MACNQYGKRECDPDQGADDELHPFRLAHWAWLEFPEFIDPIISVTMQHMAGFRPEWTMPAENVSFPDKEKRKRICQPKKQVDTKSGMDGARNNCSRVGKDKHKEMQHILAFKAAHQTAFNVTIPAEIRRKICAGQGLI